MMTREQTISILMIIQAAYPNYRAPDKTVTVNIWFEMLKDYTRDQVEAAVKAYIQSDTSGFAPSIGQVIDKLQLFRDSHDPADRNETAVWDMVYKAICNSIYHAEEEFDKFPEIVKKVIASPGQLREWGRMDIDTVNSVVASNFMRTYRAEYTRDREIRKLSPNLRRMAAGLQDGGQEYQRRIGTEEPMHDIRDQYTTEQLEERSRRFADEARRRVISG